MIKNIIFDWSGTISNDFPVVYPTVATILKRKGINITEQEFRDKYFLPYMDSIKMFVDVEKKEWDALFSAEFPNHGFPTPFKDAKDTLLFLKAKNIKMAVLSSHRQDFLEKEVKSYFNGYNFFQQIFGSVYDKVAEMSNIVSKLNFAPAETVYVGDTTHDIEAGQTAGIKTAGMLNGYMSREAIIKANPDYLLENLSDFKKIV